MKTVQYLLALSGIGAERLCLRWVSAAEGERFARYVEEYSEVIRNLGAFFPEEFDMSLGALERTFGASRLRWLMGMELKITEQGNVYEEKLQEQKYRKILEDVAEEEYEKALVLEALRHGIAAVRDIALETGLAVYKVSCRLNELERSREVELKEYLGTTPQFEALVAS
jgi:phytoene dehydrogenase-like protein